MVIFVTYGVLCQLINIRDKTEHKLNFSPRNLNFITVFITAKKGTVMLQFFSLKEGDDELLQKFSLGRDLSRLI